MEPLMLILTEAKDHPGYALFAFTLLMWWFQLKRNDRREAIADEQHSQMIVALSAVKTAVDVGNTLMQALLNRREP